MFLHDWARTVQNHKPDGRFHIVWAYVGAFACLPFSILITSQISQSWLKLAIGLAFGAFGTVLGRSVFYPIWLARRSRSKKLAWLATPEVDALKTSAEAFFLSQGQDPLRAEISAAELLTLARSIALGQRAYG